MVLLYKSSSHVTLCLVCQESRDIVFIVLQEQDVWSEPRLGRKPAYVRLPSEYAERVKAHLSESGINYNVAIPDVQQLVIRILL